MSKTMNLLMTLIAGIAWGLSGPVASTYWLMGLAIGFDNDCVGVFRGLCLLLAYLADQEE